MPRIINFEGKTQSFPDDATDAEISAALNAIPVSNAKDVPKAKTWTSSPNSAMVTAAAGEAVGPTAQALAEFGTNPNVARGAATAGRLVGGLTSMPAGLSGFGSVQKGAYAGGKAGYFTGKMLQDIARPVSTALEKLIPYAQTAATVSGAQGALDLAQMAEPNRQDIGFLGMAGKGSASDQASVIGAQIKALVTQGMAPGEAARTVYNAWAKQLREQTK